MNGEVSDWIRGLGKFPEGSQIIFNPDGSVGAVMHGGKIYQPPEGVTIPGSANPTQDAPQDDGWKWGDVLGGFGKMITDPVGSTQAMGSYIAGGVGGAAMQWLTPVIIVAVAVVILFIALQALLKTSDA